MIWTFNLDTKLHLESLSDFKCAWFPWFSLGGSTVATNRITHSRQPIQAPPNNLCRSEQKILRQTFIYRRIFGGLNGD